MPELEERIAAWRENFARAIPGHREVLEELEEHLRDQIAAAVAAGSSVEAAFNQAAERIGPPELLASQYPLGPIDGEGAACAVCRVFWGWVMVSGTIFLLLLGDTPGGWSRLLLALVTTLITGYLAVLGLGTLGLVAQVYEHRRPAGERERTTFQRGMLQMTSLALAFVGSGLVLGIWNASRIGHVWSWPPQPMDYGEYGVAIVFVILLFVGATVAVSLRRAPSYRLQCILATVTGIAGFLGFFNSGRGLVPMGFAVLCLAIAIVQLVVILLKPRADSLRT